MLGGQRNDEVRTKSKGRIRMAEQSEQKSREEGHTRKENPLREAAGLGIVFGTVAGLLARYLTGIKMMFPILILGCIIILVV